MDLFTSFQTKPFSEIALIKLVKCFSYFIGFLVLLTWIVSILGVVPSAMIGAHRGRICSYFYTYEAFRENKHGVLNLIIHTSIFAGMNI